MASSALLLPLGSSFTKRSWCGHHMVLAHKIPRFQVRCSASEESLQGTNIGNYTREATLTSRRSAIGLVLVVPVLGLVTTDADGAGLPPEQQPRLCNDECEKELENVPMVTTESGLQYKDIKIGQGPSPPIGFQVAANYVAMVSSGQIFDSSLEKGQPYIFRVGSDQGRRRCASLGEKWSFPTRLLRERAGVGLGIWPCTSLIVDFPLYLL